LINWEWNKIFYEFLSFRLLIIIPPLFHAQGYFCDGMCQNAIIEVLSQDTTQNGIQEPPFLGIGVTNLSPTKLWVTLCVLEPYFFRKIALSITIYYYPMT
jgi:hypothetical protein